MLYEINKVQMTNAPLVDETTEMGTSRSKRKEELTCTYKEKLKNKLWKRNMVVVHSSDIQTNGKIEGEQVIF